MRITKLHILFFLLLAGAGVYGAYFRQQGKVREQREQKEAQAKAEEAYLAQKRAEEEALKAEPAPAPQAAVPAPVSAPKEETPQETVYAVQKGDTLWKIAKMKEHFGEGSRWYDIWKANENKIKDFDHLVRGQELVIPLDKPKRYAWPKTDESVKEQILSKPWKPRRPQTSN